MDLASLLTGRNLAFSGFIFVVVALLKQYFAAFFASPSGQRVLPVLPIVIALAGAFLGFSDAIVWQDKVVLGFLIGFTTMGSFKIGRTSVLGRGLAAPNEPPQSQE